MPIIETEQGKQMDQFFKRGCELVKAFRTQAPVARGDIPNEPPTFEHYIAKFNNYNYSIVQEQANGEYDAKAKKWSYRTNLVVGFLPKPEDRLRFINGTWSRLPLFGVCLDDFEDSSYFGILEYDRASVEKNHRWDRIWDELFSYQGNAFENSYTVAVHEVGDSKIANKVLSNLNNRLAGNFSSVHAYKPEDWHKIAAERQDIPGNRNSELMKVISPMPSLQAKT